MIPPKVMAQLIEYQLGSPKCLLCWIMCIIVETRFEKRGRSVLGGRGMRGKGNEWLGALFTAVVEEMTKMYYQPSLHGSNFMQAGAMFADAHARAPQNVLRTAPNIS